MNGFVRTWKTLEVHYYFQRNQSNCSLLRFISSSVIAPIQGNFIGNYLINSCGLSPKSALSVSKSLNLETPERPDSVIQLLYKYGFTKSRISKMVPRLPKLLLMSPENVISPKLEFFISKGLTGADLVKLFTFSPSILYRSLKNCIVPTFGFLKDLLKSDCMVVKVIQRSYFSVLCNSATGLASKIEFLHDKGLPQKSIARLLTYSPGVFSTSWSKFLKVVETVSEMGFSPLHFTYISAIIALKGMRKSTWERKINVFKRWGLCEEEIIAAFRRQPYIMLKSEDKIMEVMDLFVDKLGWEVSFVSKYPNLFTFSLKTKLIPRAFLLQNIISRKPFRKNFGGYEFFACSEKRLLKLLNSSYGEDPDLLKLYREKFALTR